MTDEFKKKMATICPFKKNEIFGPKVQFVDCEHEVCKVFKEVLRYRSWVDCLAIVKDYDTVVPFYYLNKGFVRNEDFLTTYGAYLRDVKMFKTFKAILFNYKECVDEMEQMLVVKRVKELFIRLGHQNVEMHILSVLEGNDQSEVDKYYYNAMVAVQGSSFVVVCREFLEKHEENYDSTPVTTKKEMIDRIGKSLLIFHASEYWVWFSVLQRKVEKVNQGEAIMNVFVSNLWDFLLWSPFIMYE
jgi:hypothetical protein